jgi:predicted nucleic acid-binding protein
VIVLDASVVIEILLQNEDGLRLQERVLDRKQRPNAPHLLDVEVAQVVRRYWLAGQLTAERAQEMLDDLIVLPIQRYAHAILVPRIWELRENLTAYDATYVALAEALDAPLLTRDRRLAAAPGHRAGVELV